MSDPLIPPGTNPDDLEIKVVTPDDYDMIMIVERGVVDVRISPDFPPLIACSILMKTAFNIMQQEGISVADVRTAPVSFQEPEDSDE